MSKNYHMTTFHRIRCTRCTWPKPHSRE